MGAKNEKNGKKNEMETAVVQVINPVADQASTVLEGWKAEQQGEQLVQGYKLDDFDTKEQTLKDAILKQMDASGLARCMGTPMMYERAQEQTVIGAVSRTILSLCRCHAKNGSYRLHKLVADCTPLTSANRKTGQVDVSKAIASAIGKLMAGTVDTYEKNGTKVVAANPVKFSIEKVRKVEQYLIHFTDK